MWVKRGPIPVFLGNPPYDGRRYTSFNNDPARLPAFRLKHAPEIASDVGRKRPAPVAEAPGNIEPQHLKNGKGAEADRWIPPLPGSLESHGAVDPDPRDERRECDRTWSAAESAKRDWEERREKAILDPLTHATATDEFVEIVAGTGGRPAEVDQVLCRHRIVAEDTSGERVKEEPARAEGLLEVARQRRSQ